MSYDLDLYRKDGSKEPFEQEEVKDKLKGEFNYIKFHPDTGPVMDFEVGHENEADSIEFHYQGKDKGYYWTYCSYGISDEVFKNFKNLVKDIAVKLDMQIQDVQMGEGLIDPEEYLAEDVKSSERFGHTKKITSKVVEMLPYVLPAKKKHFILYFIMSDNPEIGKGVYLALTGNGFYASKVEAGKSIDQVVKREIPELTGSGKYKIMGVQNYDTAKDRFGNELPRYSVFIEVPYFDPIDTDRKLKHKVEWRPIQK